MTFNCIHLPSSQMVSSLWLNKIPFYIYIYKIYIYIFHFIYIYIYIYTCTTFLDPFISCRAPELFPQLDYCEQSCSKHRCASISIRLEFLIPVRYEASEFSRCYNFKKKFYSHLHQAFNIELPCLKQSLLIKARFRRCFPEQHFLSL
jgi:hypothetical protein